MKTWIRRLFKKMDQPQQTGKIIIYGTSWCYGSRRAANFLEEHKIEYEWIDIDRDERGRQFVESVNHGMRSVPTIVFPDGSTLTEPSAQELARRFNL